MKDEQAPLSDDEYVYRRVLKEHVDERLPMPVTVAGFRPTKDDEQGISVYRAEFVTPEQVDQAGRRSGSYYIVKLRVGDIRARGMDVVPHTMKPLPGHALIPELRPGLSGADKRRYKELRLSLTQLASHAFVLSPQG